MKKLHLVLTAAMACLLGGCIPSVNPIYTDKDLVYNPALEGEWKGDEESDSWKFTKKGEKEYGLEYTDKDGKKGSFSARLVKVHELLYLDLYPEPAEPVMQGNEFYKSLFVASHTFLKVPKLDETLEMSALNLDWLKDHLTANPDAVAFSRNGDRIVLTAKTADLQAFLQKLEEKKEAWGDPMKLKKKKATP